MNKQLTPKQFAALHGLKHKRVMGWLQRGLLKRARKIQTVHGHVWAIPSDAKPPTIKRGRPKKVTQKG